MSNVIYYVSYKLKKGASVPEFLDGAKKLNDTFISKQKGYVYWKQAVDDETWADMIAFETTDDLNNFKKLSENPGDTALHFYSYINLNNCREHHFVIERSYE